MTINEVRKACATEVRKELGRGVRFDAILDTPGQLAFWRVWDGAGEFIGYLLVDGITVEGFAASANVKYRDVPTFLHQFDAARAV